MKKLGVVALVLTLVLTIPILFILSRNTVNTNQFILIVSLGNQLTRTCKVGVSYCPQDRMRISQTGIHCGEGGYDL
jgi:hypothetical protein